MTNKRTIIIYIEETSKKKDKTRVQEVKPKYLNSNNQINIQQHSGYNISHKHEDVANNT